MQKPSEAEVEAAALAMYHRRCASLYFGPERYSRLSRANTRGWKQLAQAALEAAAAVREKEAGK